MQFGRATLETLINKRILQHTAFWLLIIFYFTVGYGRQGNYLKEVYRSVCFTPAHMFLVYSFFYFLIPRYLLTRKFIQFFLLGAIVYGLAMWFSYVINYKVLAATGDQTYWSFGASLLGQFTVLGLAVSIKLSKYWYRQREQTLAAQQQKTLAELELLKSQIHPHFLFNTLNNLYAHTLEQSVHAPEIVLKLSNLLRFMIYESRTPYISLKKEIILLQQYIELEQLRYGKRLDVSVSVRGEMNEYQIAPLLLLPLVENAFKHGTSTQLEQCWISIDLYVDTEHLDFKLINSRDKERTQNDVGGLGLSNVRKRLEYLYPGTHQLLISEDEDVFVVSLRLPLWKEKDPVTIVSPSSFLNQKTDEVKMFVGG